MNKLWKKDKRGRTEVRPYNRRHNRPYSRLYIHPDSCCPVPFVHSARELGKKIYWAAVVFFLAMLALASMGGAQTQQQAARPGGEAVPEPAIGAILAAFDKFEVVGVPQGHGEQDLDNFVYALVRTKTAENPLFEVPRQMIDAKAEEQARNSCLERKGKRSKPE